MTFTKLFSSITASTVWCKDPYTKVVWITMLAMADKRGRVWASIPGLAKEAGVSVDKVETALNDFLSPDHYSRTQDYEGRRIEVIDGGWKLLNHAKYRAIRDEEERRAYKTAKQREYRAVDNVDKSGQECTDVDGRGHNAEADTEAESVKHKGHCVADFDRFWQVYPKKRKKKTALEIWRRKKPNADTLIADVENRLANDGQWLDGFVPHPTTYLNGELWNDEIEPRRKKKTYAEELAEGMRDKGMLT